MLKKAWVLFVSTLFSINAFADAVPSYPSLEDNTGSGVALSKSLSGDSATGKIGSTSFSFRDSSGNLILPQLNASGFFGVTVSNFPSTFGVTQSTSPWVVSGTVSATQGTSPWVVSGTVTANIGTTGGLALDTTVSGLQVAQGSTTSGQSGSLIQGAVTTAAPSYTTAQTSPLSLTTAGALRTDGSGTTQPVSGTVTANAGTGSFTVAQATAANLNATVVQSSGSNLHVNVDSAPTTTVTGTVTANQGTSPWVVSGTVTANIGTTNGLALDATVSGLQVSQGSTTSGQKGGLTLGAVTTAAPTYTTAQSSPLSLTTAGALRVDNSANTQPISGTVTANAGTGTFTVGQATGTNLHTVVDSGSITANAGTNLNTSALALESGGNLASIKTNTDNLNLSQGSTTSGQKANLILGAVTTAAPTYTTAQSNPLSLTTAGALRTDGSGSTQPISGTVTANAGTGTFTVSGTVTANAGTGNFTVVQATAANLNMTEANSSSIATNTSNTNTSVQALQVNQGSTTSGQKGELIQGAVTTAAPSYTTAQTSPLSLTTAGALRVDNSANTQPISGTVTANAGTNLNTSALALESGGNLASIKTNTDNLNLSQASTTSGQKGNLILGAVTTAAPSYTTAQTNPLSLTTAGGLRVDGSGTTQPVSGTVTANAGTGSFTVAQATAANLNATVVQSSGANLHVNVDSAPTTTVTGTVTANQGTSPWVVAGNVASGASDSGNPVKVGAVFSTTQPTVTTGQRVDLQGTARGGLIVSTGVDNFNINNVSGTVSLPTGAATETSLAKLTQTQGSTTSGQSGPLIQGAVTTAAPSYTTAQTSPLSLNTSGGLRVDGSGVTQPVSGTVTANAGTNLNTSLLALQSGANSPLDKTASGALTALNQTVSMATNGLTTVTVQLLGTFSATAGFEGSMDGGTTWFSTSGIYLNTNLIPINQLNSTGQMGFYVGGYTNFRAKITAYTSGTMNVVMNGGTGSLANIATQVVRLADNIGQYIQSSTVNSRQRLDVNSPSSGATGSAVPFHSEYVGGKDFAGNLIALPMTSIDSSNSTTATLTANSTYTGTFVDVSNYSNLSVIVFADQVSATDGLKIEYSTDGSNTDDNDVYTIPASNGQQISVPLTAKFYRIRYVNGTTNQGAFRLQSKLHMFRPKPSSQRLGTSPTFENDAEVVMTVPGRVSMTASAPTAASIGVASTTAIAANTGRKGLIFTNTSTKTISCHLNNGTAVLNSGLTLYPGGVWRMDDYTFTTAQINCIAGGATSNLAIQELTQ